MSATFPPKHLPISLIPIHFLSHPIIYLSNHPQIYSNTHSSNPHIYLFNFCAFQWSIYSSSIHLVIYPSSIIYLPIHYLSIHLSILLSSCTCHVKYFVEYSEEFRVEEKTFSGALFFVTTLEGGRGR